MTVVGAVLGPWVQPERLREVAVAADEAGLDELWLWEDCFLQSGIASASAALAWTTRVRVGIGLLPVPLRNVALTAMEIATIERMFPGRLRVGVGHGVQDWMAQVGARVEAPVTLLREYLTALRALLHGSRVTTAGRYVHLDGVALDRPPETAPAVLAGAVGPRSLRLSGELADGTILTAGTLPDRLVEARHRIDEGRARAGRTDAHPITMYLHAGIGPDAEARLAADLQAWESPPDSGLAGDAHAIAAGLGRWPEADTIVLQPTRDDDPVEFVRFVATRLRPLS